MLPSHVRARYSISLMGNETARDAGWEGCSRQMWQINGWHRERESRRNSMQNACVPVVSQVLQADEFRAVMEAKLEEQRAAAVAELAALQAKTTSQLAGGIWRLGKHTFPPPWPRSVRLHP